MATHNDFGKRAEQKATDYLISEGYKILARNFTFQKAEIDIIALEGEVLVIVEVKARSSTAYGLPKEAVNFRKRKRIIEAAHHFVIENDLEVEVRFDIISIVENSQKFSIEHLKEAFYPFDGFVN